MRGRLLTPEIPTRAEAEILLAHVLGCSRASVIAGTHAPPDAAAQAAYEALLRRRAQGEPIAYLTGHKEFWSLDLAVTPDVLVPRPETELLVEWAVEVLSSRRKPGSRVLDVGTGSGAIALAIAKERPDAAVMAVDVSPAALRVARRNAARLGLRVELRESDLLQALDPGLRRTDEGFAVIVSNLPYVAEDDPHLADLRFEPPVALTAGADGLDAIRRLVADAPAHLAGGGWLLLEHGATQGPAVRRLLVDSGFLDVVTRRDLFDHERATGGRRGGHAEPSGCHPERSEGSRP